MSYKKFYLSWNFLCEFVLHLERSSSKTGNHPLPSWRHITVRVTVLLCVTEIWPGFPPPQTAFGTVACGEKGTLGSMVQQWWGNVKVQKGGKSSLKGLGNMLGLWLYGGGHPSSPGEWTSYTLSHQWLSQEERSENSNKNKVRSGPFRPVPVRFSESWHRFGFALFHWSMVFDDVIQDRGGSRIFGSGIQISWRTSICAVSPIFREIPHENDII